MLACTAVLINATRGRHAPLGDHGLPQRREVVDDAVVDDGDLSVHGEMRVGVDVTWGTVGRPARMRDTEGARDRRRLERAVQVGDLALHSQAEE